MGLKVCSVAPGSVVRTRQPMLYSLVQSLRYSERTKEHQCHKTKKPNNFLETSEKFKGLSILDTVMLEPTDLN